MVESELTPPSPDSPDAEPEPRSVNLSDQPWMLSVLRPALITIMAACLVLALMALIRRVAPGLPPVYTQLLVGMGMVAAVTGSLTTTWLAQPEQRGRRNIGYRAAELALILMVTRLAIWFGAGGWPGLEPFLLRPLDALLDGYFLVALLVVGLAWGMAAAMTDDLLELALRPDDLYIARSHTLRYQDTSRPVYTDRPAILRRFVARWVIGGVLLVVIAAGSRLEMPENGFMGIIRQHIDPVVVGAIILYFLLGLVLISQGQLALLRARWTLQRTPSAHGVLRTWPVYALSLIVLVGVVAALMPLGGTFRLAQILTAILAALYFAIFAAFRFFLTLFLMLMAWLTGDTPPEPAAPPPTVEPIQPEIPPEAASTVPPWAGGVVFWVAIALLLGYAAYIYFSGKGFSFAWARRLWEMLRLRWDQLFGAYQQWQAARLRAALAKDDAAGNQGGLRLPSWLRLRNLDPEGQVRYYYLSVLHRAEEAGLARRQAETPLRYAPRLAEQLETDAEGRQAIDELTEAFVQVRYAGARVAPARLARVKAVWEQIKRYLRL